MITLSNILVIVVAYCPEEDLLLQCQMNEVQYLIIDNSSQTDKTLAKNCERKQNCRYLPLNDNKGVAKAFNIGCEYAIANGFSWVVTMDQDSKMSLDILQKMLAFANKFPDLDKTAIISPLHVLAEGHKNKTGDTAQEYQEGLHPMSSGNLVNLQIWKMLGGFDNELFIDMVDIDYYCKAMVKGYKIITLNNVEMPHKLGRTKFKKLFFNKKIEIAVYNHEPIRKYYQIRNGLSVIKRYQHALTGGMNKTKRFLIYIMLETILFEKLKFKKIKYMLLGYYDFCRGITGKYEE